MPCSKVTLFLLFNTSWARASRMALRLTCFVSLTGNTKKVKMLQVTDYEVEFGF